jgi:hypothetical protein
MIKILDNFYNNIDHVLSLSDKVCSIGGCGIGLRSEPLYFIDKQLYDNFSTVVCQLHGIDRNKVKVETYFTKHTYDPERNAGLIHIDGRNPNVCDITIKDYKLIHCGLIYLTPSLDLDTGIKFYNVHESSGWDKETEFDMTLNKCYTFDQQQLVEYNKNFYGIAEAKNIQNRMVSWTAGTKYRSKMSEKQSTRIVQNFYISME